MLSHPCKRGRRLRGPGAPARRCGAARCGAARCGAVRLRTAPAGGELPPAPLPSRGRRVFSPQRYEEVRAAAAARSLLSVWDSPGPARGGKRAARATIEVRKGGCLRATGEEYCNGAGLWVKLSKVTEEGTGPPALPVPLRYREAAPACPAR